MVGEQPTHLKKILYAQPPNLDRCHFPQNFRDEQHETNMRIDTTQVTTTICVFCLFVVFAVFPSYQKISGHGELVGLDDDGFDDAMLTNHLEIQTYPMILYDHESKLPKYL